MVMEEFVRSNRQGYYLTMRTKRVTCNQLCKSPIALWMHRNEYMGGVNDPVFEKRGIIAWVHEGSIVHQLFRFLSIKLGHAIQALREIFGVISFYPKFFIRNKNHFCSRIQGLPGASARFQDKENPLHKFHTAPLYIRHCAEMVITYFLYRNHPSETVNSKMLCLRIMTFTK